MEGKVKWYNRKKGFGFIIGEDSVEYFVHYTGLSKGTFIRDNDEVSFEAVDTEKGKQAQNVVLLRKASEIAEGGSSEESSSEEASSDEESSDEESSDDESAEDESSDEE